MKLKGVIDKAFNNFISLRGYASMGDLNKISVADDSYQRDLISEHKQEMVDFLNIGEYLFFPEVILGAILEPDGVNLDSVMMLDESLGYYTSFNHNFDQFKLQFSTTGTKKPGQHEIFRKATLSISDKEMDKETFRKFNRIDGNHRLTATVEDSKFKDYNIPFCLVLFRNKTESDRFSRALFHNINYKHMPLTMEQSLKLILDNAEFFPDDKLKEDASFGWSYYLARKLNEDIKDLSLLPHIKPTFEKSTRTFSLNLFDYLLKNEVIEKDEKSMALVKKSLVDVNSIYGTDSNLKISTNSRILEAFIFYRMKDENLPILFKNWIVENHIYAIEEPEILLKYDTNELVAVFDKIMESRKRTIFISMQFSDETNENYEAIKNAVDEINNETKLDLKIQEIRIDLLSKGHSYKINTEILELVEGCGYLIADLSLGNKNVYHEIGYLMGLNQGKFKKQNNFILLHNEKTADSNFKDDVGFNIKEYKVLKTDGTNDLRKQIKEQIKIYYGI